MQHVQPYDGHAITVAPLQQLAQHTGTDPGALEPRGQIDELKETQAAVLRVQNGLSTYEDEIARLGGDWRKKFRQMSRERKMAKLLELPFAADPPADTTNTMNAASGTKSVPGSKALAVGTAAALFLDAPKDEPDDD